MELNASPLEIKQKADSLYTSQNYAAAAEEYRNLVVAQPGSPSAMKSLGMALVLAKQTDEGLSILKSAAAMQPTDAEIRYAYGYGLGTVGSWDDSITELDAALNLAPNHIPARQGLIYALLTSGQAIIQVDPVLGEQRLDRAHKLDQRNAHIAHALLDHLVATGQKGKAVNLIKGFDDQLKSQSPLKEYLEKLESDPDYKVHLKQASMSKPSASLTPAAPASQTLKQVPCPFCKLMIMDYAAICPHCNQRLRATGTFAGRDNGPKYEWQEIALPIASLIFIAQGGIDMWQIYPFAKKTEFTSFISVLLVFDVFQMVMGLSALLRIGWLCFIAKIYCYMKIMIAGAYFMAEFFGGRYVLAAKDFLNLVVACLLVYLINYVVGD